VYSALWWVYARAALSMLRSPARTSVCGRSAGGGSAAAKPRLTHHSGPLACMPAGVRGLAACRSKAPLTHEAGPYVQSVTGTRKVIGLADSGTDTLA
jgi:acetyl esterase/lipase